MKKGKGPDLREEEGAFALTADEFERQYAARSDVTVAQLRVYRTVRPCDYGADNCEGWQSISHARAIEYDEEHHDCDPGDG